MSGYWNIFRDLSRPLRPIPTEATPRLVPLDEIQVVLFDVYGTLFISGSGDVGVAQESGTGEALIAALRACGYEGPVDAPRGIAMLLEMIRGRHRRERDRGIEYPEVEIIEIWRTCLADMERCGWLSKLPDEFDAARLAVEYEVRANPAWLMPGARETLAALRQAGMTLGIVSNAQFYTREMIAGLVGQSPEEIGFDPDLQFYSYHYRRAKPDRFLYDLAANALVKRGHAPQNILYVGNDMLNDIRPAVEVGFRTALFAGDLRSLRRRDGDSRVDGVRPDLVLVDLLSLLGCVLGGSSAETAIKRT